MFLAHHQYAFPRYPTRSLTSLPFNFVVSTANLFQALHYDNQMTSKRVRLFWTIFVVMFFWEIIPQCE